MGNRHHRRGRVRSLELGWRCVEASGDGSCCSVVLGRVSPDKPGRRSDCHREGVEDASGGSSAYPFDLFSRIRRRWESSWAMILPCSSWSSLHVARRDTTGNVLASRAATWLHTRGMPATRLRIGRGGWPQAIEWFWSGQRRSSPVHSRFFQRQSHVLSLWPIGSLARDQGRGRPPEAFPAWQTKRRDGGAYRRLGQCPYAATRRAKCCLSCWPSRHARAACRPR